MYEFDFRFIVKSDYSFADSSKRHPPGEHNGQPGHAVQVDAQRNHGPRAALSRCLPRVLLPGHMLSSVLLLCSGEDLIFYNLFYFTLYPDAEHFSQRIKWLNPQQSDLESGIVRLGNIYAGR